jgi:uncharacterized protein (UPF0332 family)
MKLKEKFDYKIFLNRAKEEEKLARVLFRISTDRRLQQEELHLESTSSFHNAVISHAYYSIFYSTKAYLLKKGIRTHEPAEHRKVCKTFERFVISGTLSTEIRRFVKDSSNNGNDLLSILKNEKKKRGEWTYEHHNPANRIPTQKSLDNANMFIKTMSTLCEII